MAYTIDEKIKNLQVIMDDQCQYLNTCFKIRCKRKGNFIIIRKYSVISENRNTQIKFPISEIDNVTKRERALLHLYNKNKDINKAILELEVLDNIKNAMK